MTDSGIESALDSEQETAWFGSEYQVSLKRIKLAELVLLRYYVSNRLQ